MKKSEFIRKFEEKATTRLAPPFNWGLDLHTALELVEEAGIEWDPEETDKLAGVTVVFPFCSPPILCRSEGGILSADEYRESAACSNAMSRIKSWLKAAPRGERVDTQWLLEVINDHLDEERQKLERP